MPVPDPALAAVEAMVATAGVASVVVVVLPAVVDLAAAASDVFRQREKDDRIFQFLKTLNVSDQYQDDCRLIDTSVYFFITWLDFAIPSMKTAFCLAVSASCFTTCAKRFNLQRLRVAHVLPDGI